jgi:hypothetical protein
MKKPNFIEIRLPGRKSTFSAAKRKYFKRLEGKVLKVNFGKERQKKEFEYKVTGSSFYSWTGYWNKEKTNYWSLKLELKVLKEDPEKVL